MFFFFFCRILLSAPVGNDGIVGHSLEDKSRVNIEGEKHQ